MRSITPVTEREQETSAAWKEGPNQRPLSTEEDASEIKRSKLQQRPSHSLSAEESKAKRYRLHPPCDAWGSDGAT